MLPNALRFTTLRTNHGVQFSAIQNRDTGRFQVAAILPSGTAVVSQGSDRAECEAEVLARVDSLLAAETEEV